MKTVYKVLAYLMALEVVVQGATIAFGVAGLGIWIEEGNSADSAAFEGIFEGEVTFTGVAGILIHGMNGMMVIPALALVLLVVSFFAKVPGGVRAAAVVFLLVILQVALGLFGHTVAFLGLLHGVNAFLLFGAAGYAARLANTKTSTPAEESYVAA